MNFKRSFALISTATLLAFSCSVVHADSARQSKIKELDGQRSELAKRNGVTGYLADGRWYSLIEGENKVDSLKKQVEVLKVPYSEKNTIKVSSEYAKALKDNFNLKKSEGERERAEEILKSESAKLVLQKNNFVTAASDEIEVYDVDKLPKDVVIELNYFALDMINQVRRQMGTPEVTLAQSSIDFASKLSAKVKEANRGVWDWHYVKGINEVAREYGLPTSSKEDEEKEYGYQYYENSAGSFSVSKQSSKAELKRAIYDAILRFLYDGDEFLHANSISGLNWGEPSKAEYFGFSMNLLKDGTEMSFITVSDDQLSKSTKKNFSTKTPANTTESNRKAVLGKKEKELESEKGKLEKLQLSYKEYEKISKEIDRLNEEEEKEKERIRKEEQNKKNSATTKPSQSTQKQDKPKTNASSSKQGSSTVSKNGWLKENGSWYLYNAGKRLTNTWQGSYYLKSDGKMAENEWVYDPSYKAWYYLNENGAYVKDTWQGSYYLKSDGKMADKEWVYDSYYGSWFYLKSGGDYANSEWYYDSYYGSWYYFKSGGYMAKNMWQGSYYLKSNGAMAKNEWVYDTSYKAWYYLKSSGSYARSEWVQGSYWVDSSGKWV